MRGLVEPAAMLRRVEQLDFSSPDDIRFGRGAVSETASYVSDDATVLVVTDPGIVDAGLIDPVVSSLEGGDVDYEVFDGVEPDPKVSNAMACLDQAETIGADVLVGVGGGSSLDVTKTASALLTNDAPIEGLFGRHNVPTEGAWTVLLPTTSGTGSEMSPASVLFDDREGGTGEKEAIIDHALFANMALIDPDLTMHLPSPITRATGLDAFAHAIGSYMATTTNTFADALCVESMMLIEEHLRDAAFHGADAPAAREKMSLAASMAMLGRINGGKAVIHSIAYGIQAMYDVPHAEAIAMVLPEVVEYNLPAATESFARLGTRMYEADGSTRDRAQTLVDGVYQLRDDLGLDQTLTEVGTSEDDVDELVELATHSDRHLGPNPRDVTHDDAETILREVW
jgi:alcohol dehydrogenase class IV